MVWLYEPKPSSIPKLHVSKCPMTFYVATCLCQRLWIILENKTNSVVTSRDNRRYSFFLVKRNEFRGNLENMARVKESLEARRGWKKRVT